jgi:membrane-bound inhibitor of C-type lysozyme
MNTSFMRRAWLAPVMFMAVLSGCASVSNVNLWPFGDDKPAGRSGPENATEFQCDGNKHFYVRYADNGNTAWVIYPDREVALTKDAGRTHYTNGIAVLDVNGAEASLKEGQSINYSGCKLPEKAK